MGAILTLIAGQVHPSTTVVPTFVGTPSAQDVSRFSSLASLQKTCHTLSGASAFYEPRLSAG